MRDRRKLNSRFPPDLVRFLDALARDPRRKATSRPRLSRSALIRALAQAFMEGAFDVKALRSEEEFVDALLAQIRRRTRRGTRNDGV